MPLPLAIPIGMAAAGLFSSVLGAKKSGEAMNKAEGIVDNQVNNLTSWYDTEKNKDYLQSNVASSAINRMLEEIEARNKVTESSAAVTGASDASVLAQKANSQEQLGDTMQGIAAQGTRRQDNVEGDYRSSLNQLLGQKTNIELGRAQNAGNLVDAGGKLMGASAGLMGETKWGGSGDITGQQQQEQFGRLQGNMFDLIAKTANSN